MNWISQKKLHRHARCLANILPIVALTGCVAAPDGPHAAAYSQNFAGTVYRCNSATGQVTLSDQPLPGLQCAVFSSAPPHTDTPPSPPRLPDMHGHGPDDIESVVVTPLAHTGKGMMDFGDPRAAAVLEKMRTRNPDGFRYMQLGDSHTAGHFITDAIRNHLHPLHGVGGVGWLPAAHVRGQRTAVPMEQKGPWKIKSSRTADFPDEYPFGGVIAEVAAPAASLTVGTYAGKNTGVFSPSPLQQISVWLRQVKGATPMEVRDSAGKRQSLKIPTDGRWHIAHFEARLPVRIMTTSRHTSAIGGWWMHSPHGGGTIVSASGLNGATLAQTSRWRNAWPEDLQVSRPDIIALAFGTNESNDENLDIEKARTALIHTISALRHAAPQAAILIIGPPDSLKNREGECGTRLPHLNAIQHMQRSVAAEMRTLYFDWQQAMQGRCSMVYWIEQGLAKPDGVHFSAEGYLLTGTAIFEGLRTLADTLATPPLY